jgi:arginyl-tRNA synthetase
MKAEKEIIDFLKKETKLKKIELEVPPDLKLGDFAFPCFELSKELKKKPSEIAKELKEKFKPTKSVSEAKVAGPYLNFFVDNGEAAEEVLTQIHKEKDKYGESNENKGKTVVMDYSHPNIAKPFGIGHLRSTVIGNALKKMYRALGYKVVGVNHLGDWGTQFGKLIVAYKAWGDDSELEKNSITHLLNIYVKFHEEAEIRPELIDEARSWFKRLEDGDEEAYSLWELFKKLSLDEFRKYYEKLDVEFESYHGEAFYNDKIDEAIKRVQGKTETEMSEGALIVNLGEEKPPLLLRKSDGASTYHTRDLAAAFYRLKEYNADKLIYVVGADQKLHFEQLFEVLSRVGIDKEKLEHTYFGLMKFAKGKMSTREGNIIFLEEVLDKTIELAFKIIKEKNPDLENKHEVAEQVGIGAIIFGDLINDRVKDVVFSWDKILDFEGETAPYLQYAHARCCSILKKYGKKVDVKIDFSLLKENEERQLVMKLARFNKVIADAANHNKPHILAKYLIDIGQTFNSFYVEHQVISDDKDLAKARILLVDSVRQVISNGLGLLGVKAPSEM